MKKVKSLNICGGRDGNFTYSSRLLIGCLSCALAVSSPGHWGDVTRQIKNGTLRRQLRSDGRSQSQSSSNRAERETFKEIRL